MGRGGLMLLWRLSIEQFASNFDGGYGRFFDGRWNTIEHAVTYCASSPSLCVLEKLVHVEDPTILPDLVMVTYDVPERTEFSSIGLNELPEDWRRRERLTQQRGDAWHGSRSTLLLKVPSAIVPLKDSPDVNVMINHSHPRVTDIKIRSTEPFALDQRLL
jgi:RES domain-containing protein